jgi:uncharacterized membrane protein
LSGDGAARLSKFRCCRGVPKRRFIPPRADDPPGLADEAGLHGASLSFRGLGLTDIKDAPPPVAVHIDETISSIAKLRAEHHDKATPLQRMVDRLVTLLARPRFIGLLGLAMVAWIGFNLLSAALGDPVIDAPPFPWLGEAISLTSLLMVVLILISQQREDQLARHREMLILELAILSEQKIAKVIQLLEESRRDNPNLRDRRDPEAETMGQAADTQSVLNAITETPALRPE